MALIACHLCAQETAGKSFASYNHIYSINDLLVFSLRLFPATLSHLISISFVPSTTLVNGNHPYVGSWIDLGHVFLCLVEPKHFVVFWIYACIRIPIKYFTWRYVYCSLIIGQAIVKYDFVPMMLECQIGLNQRKVKVWKDINDFWPK